MIQSQAFRPKRFRKVGDRIHDRLAVMSHGKGGVTRAKYEEVCQPGNLAATKSKAMSDHGCVYVPGADPIHCKNLSLKHREAVALLDKTGRLAQEDAIVRTGARTFADSDLFLELMSATAVNIYPEYVRFLSRRFPHLFLNEAVMHLIDEEMARSKKIVL